MQITTKEADEIRRNAIDALAGALLDDYLDRSIAAGEIERVPGKPGYFRTTPHGHEQRKKRDRRDRARMHRSTKELKR